MNSRQEPMSEYVGLCEVLAEGLQRREDPAVVARRKEQYAFLENCIFAGLSSSRPTWDSVEIAYLEAKDFAIVLQRCLEVGVQVFGVEVFTKEGRFVAKSIPTCVLDANHQAFVQNLPIEEGLILSATYGFDGVTLDGSCQSKRE